jgi:hypothetical protein
LKHHRFNGVGPELCRLELEDAPNGEVRFASRSMCADPDFGVEKRFEPRETSIIYEVVAKENLPVQDTMSDA